MSDVQSGSSGQSPQGWTINGVLGSGLSDAQSALNAYKGIQNGTAQGYAGAAINSGRLAGKLGAFGGPKSAINQGFGDAANALGIYSGIKQGGPSGYGGAAINAAQLGSKLGAFGGASSGIGAAAGYAAIPLALYNEVNNWESGNTGSDALSGAETGAAIGSVIPGIGTVIGGLVGGAAGALSSAFGPGRRDPETTDWGGLTAAYNRASQQGGRQAQQNLVSGIQDPYELMAGMFDLRNGQIDKGNTLYNEYGRMGEQKFTNDLANQLNQAKASGKITPDMDASQIYSSVIDPWEQSWGKGANTDPNSQLIKDMTTQMISQYEGGQAADNWRSVGGQNPFADIYANAPHTWGQSAKTQAAPMASGKTPMVDRLGVPMQGYYAAKGGHTQVLEALRRKHPPHFDDGGDVSFDDYSGPSFTPGTDYNSIYEGGSGSETTDFSNHNFGDLQQQFDNDQAINQQLGTWLDNYESAHSASGSGSGSKGSSGGIGGLGKAAAPYAALLPIISGLLHKTGSGGSSGSGSLPPGMSAGPTEPFQPQVSPRTSNPIDPNTDWYTYGQHPEKEFFSNNSIGPLMGKFAQQPSSALSGPSPSSPGNMHPMPVGMGDSRPVLRAHGGALDHLGEGTLTPGESRYVQGPGDGQSDDIDAKLSDGEYVMDAHTVSLLGNGSNEAGAKRLDQLRENLRKSAAKPMAKGKQFMHAKSPEHYLKGGRKVKGRSKPVAFDTQIGGEADGGDQ